MRILGLMFILGLSIAGYCGDISAVENQVTKLFPAKSIQRIEMTFPAEGFVGSPESPAQIPSARIPQSEEDYIKRYVAISVAGQRNLQNGKRIVLQIDEIDKDGKVITPGLYFAYIDIMGKKVDMLCKYKDDNRAVQDNGIRDGLPFPLAYTIPLGLLNDAGKEVDGYIDGREHGAIFSKAALTETGEETSGSTTVTAFQRLPEGLRIIAKEIQTWKSTTDWLWTDMQRTDRDGNIIMTCRRL